MSGADAIVGWGVCVDVCLMGGVVVCTGSSRLAVVYTQSTCSQGGGPCEGFEKRWRTTTTSVRGV